MTTEQIQFITQQIRSRYHGLPVLTNSFYVRERLKPARCVADVFISKDWYLQLRSIEFLSDNECIELAKLINAYTNYGTQPPELIRELLKDYFYKTANQMTGEKWFLIRDYLTQIGIALPHFIILPNGETFTASVEWQIENNIIKI